MSALAKTSLKAVGVQQFQEELKIFLFAVVRRGGHQQEMPRQLSQQSAQLVSLGLLQSIAKIGG